MKERIKELRKTLGLTMEKFGEGVGLTKAAVSRAEAGKSNLSDVSINSICRTYGVNEQWLRTGAGDMFLKKSDEEEIQAFADKVMQDVPESFRKRFVSMLAKLSDEQWNVLSEMTDMLVKGENPQPVSSKKDPKDMTDEEIEEEGRKYAAQLREEKQAAAASSASPITKDA